MDVAPGTYTLRVTIRDPKSHNEASNNSIRYCVGLAAPLTITFATSFFDTPRHSAFQRTPQAKKRGEPLQLSPEKVRFLSELENDPQTKLNYATGQANIAFVGEADGLGTGVIQSNVREITVGVDAIARIRVIQDVER